MLVLLLICARRFHPIQHDADPRTPPIVFVRKAFFRKVMAIPGDPFPGDPAMTLRRSPVPPAVLQTLRSAN